MALRPETPRRTCSARDPLTYSVCFGISNLEVRTDLDLFLILQTRCSSRRAPVTTKSLSLRPSLLSERPLRDAIIVVLWWSPFYKTAKTASDR